MSAAEAIERDERRAARDSFRAAGGSHKRALKTFYTASEKREKRDEHGERLRGMVEWIEANPEAAGRAILRSLDLHPDVSACNAALLAYQVPDELALTYQAWRKVGGADVKGCEAVAYITGPGFWPRPVFTAAQARQAELAEQVAADERRGLVGNEPERIAAAVAECDRKPKAVAEAVAALLAETPAADRPVLDEDFTAALAAEEGDLIPF